MWREAVFIGKGQLIFGINKLKDPLTNTEHILPVYKDTILGWKTCILVKK